MRTLKWWRWYLLPLTFMFVNTRFILNISNTPTWTFKTSEAYEIFMPIWDCQSSLKLLTTSLKYLDICVKWNIFPGLLKKMVIHKNEIIVFIPFNLFISIYFVMFGNMDPYHSHLFCWDGSPKYFVRIIHDKSCLIVGIPF